MKKFLEYLIKQIIDNPDELSIEENVNDTGLHTYTIHANKEDMGKIIGRSGKIIQSIRNIGKIMAIKEKKQIRIEIA